MVNDLVENSSSVLFNERLIERGMPMRHIGNEYCYPPKGVYQPIRITEYEVMDQDTGGLGGVAFDVSGGVGQSQVCIFLKTKYGGSYNYKFTVYGVPTNNGGTGTGYYGGMGSSSNAGLGNGNYGGFGTGSYGMPNTQGTGIGGYGSAGLGTGYGSGNNINNYANPSYGNPTLGNLPYGNNKPYGSSGQINQQFDLGRNHYSPGNEPRQRY